MAFLFGKKMSREEILQRVGNMEQISYAKRLMYYEGKAAGVEIVQINTGGGLQFEVLLGRGMDIGRVDFRGEPVAWLSPNGVVSSQYYEAAELGWLRSFYGGLVTTCGLTHLGTPCVDPGHTLDIKLGLHGRIANIPAENVKVDTYWEGDEYYLSVKGIVRETAVFGERVELHREIRTCLGSSEIQLIDSVTNTGFSLIEHMLLYHCNIGYPLLTETSVLSMPSEQIVPREDHLPLDDVFTFPSPSVSSPERVYYHRMKADEDGTVCISISNDRNCLSLKYLNSELPYFVQWKLTEAGYYVLGLEPGICYVEGREVARKKHELQFLQPQETRKYHLTFRMDNRKES